MPISLICGACEAKLTVPDSAAGKRGKCPRCQALLEIPHPEPDDAGAVEQPAPKRKPVPPAAPKRKPVVLEADDDGEDTETERPARRKRAVEDDEDDPPRKKPKKKGKKKAAGPPLPLLVGGGLLALAVVGFLVWYLAIREPQVAKAPITNPPSDGGTGTDQPGGTGRPGPGGPAGSPVRGAPPAGWKQFDGEGFSCWLPQNVTLARNPQAEAAATRNGIKPVIFANAAPPIYLVSLVPLPASAAAEFERDPNRAWTNALAGVAGSVGGPLRNQKTATVGGLNGRQAEVTTQGVKMVFQMAFSGGNLVSIQVLAPDLNGEADERVKPFLDGFALTR